MTDSDLSEEDKALFREHMQQVKPLTVKARATNKSPPTPNKMRQPLPKDQETRYFLSDYIQETVLSETILSYSIPSLSKQRFNALKKGAIPWEARLDLHGLHKDAACKALCDFLQLQAKRHKRSLLIVHGKGGQQGEPPCLKNQIHRWLPQIDIVQAYHSATPKDGGAGAVYVLIKTN